MTTNTNKKARDEKTPVCVRLNITSIRLQFPKNESWHEATTFKPVLLSHTEREKAYWYKQDMSSNISVTISVTTTGIPNQNGNLQLKDIDNAIAEATDSVDCRLDGTHLTPKKYVIAEIPEVLVPKCTNAKFVINMHVKPISALYQKVGVNYSVEIPFGKTLENWIKKDRLISSEEEELIQTSEIKYSDDISVLPGGDFIASVREKEKEIVAEKKKKAKKKAVKAPEDESTFWFNNTDRDFIPEWTPGEDGWFYGILQIYRKFQDKKWNDLVYSWRNSMINFHSKQAENFWPLSHTSIATQAPNEVPPIGPLFLVKLEDFLRSEHTSPELRGFTEEFAFKSCHHQDYPRVLDMCIKYSYNPFLTLLSAYRCCSDRVENPTKYEKRHSISWEEHTMHTNKVIRTFLNLSVELEAHTTNVYHHAHRFTEYSEDKNNNENNAYGNYEEFVARKREAIDFLISRVVLNDMVERVIGNIVFHEIEDVCTHPVVKNLIDLDIKSPTQTGPLFPYACCGNNDFNLMSPLSLYILHFVSYLVFLILLVFLISNKSVVSNSAQLSFRNYLANHFFGDFYAISNVNDFWLWLNSTVLPSAIPEFAQIFYLSYPEIYLRQFRVNPIECPKNNVTALWVCYPLMTDPPPYNLPSAESNSWQGTPWKTFDTLESYRGSPYFRYPPSGYTQVLTGNLSHNVLTVNELILADWIDDGSRAVFVDFWLGATSVRLYARVTALVEFTSLGEVIPNQVIDLIWVEPLNYYYLAICIILIIMAGGLVVQEFTEFLFVVRTLRRDKWFLSPFSPGIEELKSRLIRQQKLQLVDDHELQAQLQDRRNWEILITALRKHFFDAANVLDFVVTISIVVFLVCYIYVSWGFPDEEFTPEIFSKYYVLSKIAEFSGAIGMIFVFVRVMYFALPFSIVSTFILGLQNLLGVTAQFFFGFIILIIGFATSLSVLYGSTSSSWSNLSEYFSALQNSLAGYDHQVDNSGFTPYAFYWLGDILLLFYLVISLIISINMLIAMMGNKFNYLVENKILERKMAFAKATIYHNTENYLLPPPFNIIHLFILGITVCLWEDNLFARWHTKPHISPYQQSVLLKEIYFKYKNHINKNGDNNDNNSDNNNDNSSDNNDGIDDDIDLKKFVFDFFKQKNLAKLSKSKTNKNDQKKTKSKKKKLPKKEKKIKPDGRDYNDEDSNNDDNNDDNNDNINGDNGNEEFAQESHKESHQESHQENQEQQSEEEENQEENQDEDEHQQTDQEEQTPGDEIPQEGNGSEVEMTKLTSEDFDDPEINLENQEQGENQDGISSE